MPGSHLGFVRTLDFGVLDGLGARAAAEIRAAEDALIAFTEAQQKRDACTSRRRSRSRRSTTSKIASEALFLAPVWCGADTRKHESCRNNR